MQFLENEWEILTDTGWSDFDGLKITESDKCVRLQTERDTLDCTFGHKVLTEYGWKEVECLRLGDEVITQNGTSKVVSLKTIFKKQKFYDIVGVENNSRYYTNNILSHNCDEFAHMLPNLAEEFIASVFPTVSSAKTSKLVLISTPNGMNHYYKMWKEAEEGKNGFVPVEGKWQEHPDRDDAWAAKMLAQLGEIKYNQEVLCSFIGSSYTLIDGNKLATFPIIEHKAEISGVKIFEHPQENRNYVITVDTSRGQHLDYSAFVVFDATTMPYKVVATFKNNRIPSSEYPFLIYRMAQYYKDAYVLVEVNDIGGEVANILWYEYEYEHVYFTGKTKAESQAITEGKGYPGIRTTKSVKTKGTATLKDLIEKDQLFFTSFEIIQELSVFVKKRASYAADDELINDDLTTCLWLFAWLSKQPIFSEINNTNTRQTLLQNRAREIENSLVPFGFVSTTEEIKQPSGLRPDESIMDWFGRAGVTELPVGMTIDEWIMGE